MSSDTPRDIWHGFECANPSCASVAGPGRKTGVVLEVRMPPHIKLKSHRTIDCPVCGASMRYDGFIHATESGHFPNRG